MEVKKLRNEFFKRCLQTFNNNGIITPQCTMQKEDARPLYNAIKRSYTGGKPISFCEFLMALNKLKIVLKPGNRKIVAFNKPLLDAIIEDENYMISPPVSKVIVSQSFAFKKEKKKLTGPHGCPTCNLECNSETSLLQHKASPRHTLKNVAQSRNDDEIFAEIIDGKGNAPERVNCFQNRTVLLKIRTTSKNPVVFKKVTVINSVSSITMIPPGPDSPLTNTTTVKFTVMFEHTRSVDYPIVVLLEKAGKEATIFKQLYFDFHDPEFDDLHQSSPWIRGRPIVKEIDEVIIPGERPVFAASFKPKIVIQQYKLTKDMITVLNAGLKPDKLNPECEKIRKQILNTLDVPDSTKCLTIANYTEMLKLLLFVEEHQMQIDIRRYDIESGELTKSKGRNFNLEVPELSENRPSLIVGDSVFINEPGSKTVYRAFVHEKKQTSVDLSIHKSFADKIFLPGKKFNIRFDFNRITLKLEHQAVGLIQSQGAAKSFFPLQGGTNKLENLSILWLNKDITRNDEQMRAVRHILCNTSFPAPYLIFGPPGTGKTMTVVEAIYQIWKRQPTKKILVCAPSNNAANVICERLTSIPKADMLRYMSYSFPRSEIKESVMRYCNYDRDVYYHPEVEELMKYRVVISTLSTAGRIYNVGVPSGHFQYVFIDESGHATESETLIALAGIFTNFGNLSGQLVLAGDPKQLGPIIHSTLANKYGYGTSMLERLMNTLDVYQKHDGAYNNDVLTKLLNNYRSHESILRIPNDKFYDGELVIMGSENSNIALGHEVLKNPKFPMIFHTVFGRDEREANSPSFFNVSEVAVVIEYLQKLIGTKMSGRKITERDIGVITPYRKQVKKIRNQCQKRKWDKIDVGSVEQFQGQERTIIIISTVRSKPEYVEHDYKFHLGFLKNPKRFNVAVTRAKALLIVIGNPELLQYDELWHEYISLCKNNGSTFGGNFNLKPMAELKKDDYHELVNNMKNMGIIDNDEFSRGQV